MRSLFGKAHSSYLLLILFLCIGCFSFGQIQRSYHWYFGWRAGLDFSSGSAVADTTGELKSIEAASSISDTLGNLLFYCNGQNAWNRNGVLFPNSPGLIGNESSAQGTIIVPVPKIDSLYYLFNTGSFMDYFRYNVVNIKSNGGLGDILLPKNNTIHTLATEAIAATKHCNGVNYWVMTRRSAKDTLKFYAYEVKPNGIQPAVISKFLCTIAANNTVDGLTFSQDGKKLIFTGMGIPLFVFDFNKSTGQLTLNTSIPNLNNEYFYSSALSPNATKLYVTGWRNFDHCRVLQYDLSAANITQSRITLDSVGFNGSSTGYGYIGNVRLAPDQKIYISRWHDKNPYVIDPSTNMSLDSLAVVQNPNTGGIGCNYQRNGFYLKGKTTQMSLPNFVSNFTSTLSTTNALSVNINTAIICAGTPTTIIAQINSTNSAITYTWLPGGANTPSLQVSPLANTIYTLTGNDPDGCSFTATTSVMVTQQLSVTINQATICLGNSVTLNADVLPVSNANFSWSPSGQTTSTISVSPSSTSTYSVFADINGCTGNASTTVNVLSTPTLQLVPHLTLIQGENGSLEVSGANSYTWSPGNNLSCINCANPLASPLETIIYCVSAGEDVCVSVACVTVDVICGATDIPLPNAFTPNGDGENDKFCMQGWEKCVEKFTVTIFDRWGEKVFESTDPNFCWDGIYKGKILNQDVFVYFIEANLLNSKKISKKGNITLIR